MPTRTRLLLRSRRMGGPPVASPRSPLSSPFLVLYFCRLVACRSCIQTCADKGICVFVWAATRVAHRGCVFMVFTWCLHVISTNRPGQKSLCLQKPFATGSCSWKSNTDYIAVQPSGDDLQASTQSMMMWMHPGAKVWRCLVSSL